MQFRRGLLMIRAPVAARYRELTVRRRPQRVLRRGRACRPDNERTDPHIPTVAIAKVVTDPEVGHGVHFKGRKDVCGCGVAPLQKRRKGGGKEEERRRKGGGKEEERTPYVSTN